MITKKDCFKLIARLKDFGMKKITFAGGEPTTCCYLRELIRFSKKLGLTTCVISNGILLNKKFIKSSRKILDWIGFSLDSGNEWVQQQLGRGNGNYVKSIREKASYVKKAGIKLKINTVITRLNWFEKMDKIIDFIKPNRWKVFQALLIHDQNQKSLRKLLVTDYEFELFFNQHSHLKPIVESSDSMIDSYLMIDPQGRFFQNTGHSYTYSRPILEIGVQDALDDIQFNRTKFLERGGIYSW